MKLKKYSLVILSISLILLLFVSSASAADSNGTNVLSIDESASTINENLALDYSPDTSGESNDTNIIENNENNLLSADNDESGNVLREGTGTFADLQTEISTALSSGDYVNLTKDTYTYAGSGSQIEIGKSCTIDGNGAVIDMANSGPRAFYVTTSGVTIKNLTIKNANFDGNGGAIYFSSSGTVENCNFTANQASCDGGAVYFLNNGDVTNCNFTNNKVTGDESWGGAIRMSSGSVTNCNFTANQASHCWGGAIFMSSGSVTNCNFANNHASKGGSILSQQWLGVTADTCIFKTNSDEPFNTRNLPPTLNVDNFTTVYGSGEKLTFDLKTNSGIPVTNGNISISVYFKNNNSLVGNYNCLSGEEWTVNLPVGYYYAIFDTEYAEFKPFNRTITILAPEYTFWALNHAINANDNSVINLSNDYYFDSEYDSEFVNGVVINRPLTINGNGHTIDALQKARIFQVTAGNAKLNNITFTNANCTGKGGAIYFNDEGNVSKGNVINCNFAGNKATGSDSWGGAIFMSSGSVENCNFTNNTASGDGGAIYFDEEGTVTNCNFVNNRVTDNESHGGAIYMYAGTVENSNLTNNYAENEGGAIWFKNMGNVTNCNFNSNSAIRAGAIYFGGTNNVVENCNFTGNNATTGSAIYFWSTSATKTVSNSCFLNNRANAEDLKVTKNENNITIIFTGNDNLLNAIYSRNDAEVTFTNVTYWSAKGITNTGSSPTTPARFKNEAGQNITIGIVVNDELVLSEVYLTNENGTIVLDIKAGENYFIGVRHDTDSYYTEKLNTTSNNTKFSVNVTSQTTNNRTVNITAKSNIPNEVIKGKLLFILPNGTEINASYTTNGTWWALHTFDDAGDYNINAIYIGLDNVTINNATISIRYDTRVDVNNKTLNLLVGDNFTIVATTVPEGINVTFVQDDSGVYIVDENGNVTALKNGTGSILVKVGGGGKYAENSTIINVTVTKVPTEITVLNDTIVLAVSDEIDTGAALTPPDAGNLTYSISNSTVVKVENGEIIALKEGNATITVSFRGDNKYAVAENKTINVTVNLNDVSVDVNNKTLDLLVDDTFTIVATTTPEGLKVSYVVDDSGVYSVDEDGNVIGLREGEGSILIKVGGDGIYAENYTIVNVTVSKVPTEITVDPNSLDLFVGDEIVIVATLTPAEAGNVTFTSSDDSIVIVDEKGNVIANGKGQAIITVSFAGDNKYAAAENKTVTVDVSLNDASVSVDNDTLDLKVDETYQINATKHPDTILLDITYKSDNNSVATVDKNGVVTALGEGTAIITVEVGDGEIYAENSTNVTVTVKKVNPAMNITSDEITEGENATISVTLPSDATGNVNTTFNGETYSSEVKDGKAVIIISDLLKGDYTLPITYSGDDKYNPLTKEVNISVEGGKAIISAPELVKYYSGPERFTVNLTYAKGSPAANKPVNITINGVTYTRTTDENGTASLNINLGAGKYDVTINADDVTADSVVTVLSTINASDIESKSKSLVFEASFIDGEGNPLTDGTNVSFNINGVIYNSTVKGGNGSASIDLTLDSGRYIITSYNPVSGEHASNNIAVDLKDTDMVLSGDEITAGENATIDITLPSDATGNVTASVNGKAYFSEVKDGKSKIIIPDLAAGNYTVPVSYSGDDKYNSAAGDANITVNKADAAMTIDAPAITVGENATVTVTLPPDATGSVTIGNETIPVKDTTATAIISDLPAGTNTIPVKYSGDDKYNPIESTADIIVNEKPAPAKENLTIRATADEITEGENATVIITGLENATGNVSASVNGKRYTAPVKNGEATVNIPDLTENTTAVINYPGDDKYNPATATVNITVNRNTVTINAENLTKYYKDPQKFTVNVTDAKGQASANKTVEITINGVTYKRTTDENGTASLNINLNSGEYPVSVAVDDTVVNSTVTVKSTIDATDVIKMFRNDTQYYARFTDANGNILENTQVSFNLNGIIYNRTTGGNGTAKMNINLGAGDYIITATNPVTGEMKSNSIKVISLIESDDLTKYYRNASQFVVRIHSADGAYVGAGEEVTFNINGVFYTRTTNATGHAKLNINLPQGNYTITTSYKDCSQGNSIEVLPILSAEDLSMKYRDGSQFKAQLVDGQGRAYAGQSVQFNINGVLYNRVTGSDGVAKLNINLMSGEYIITSSYNGFNIANKITIRG